MTLTCPSCSYSRRRVETYRDFSLDVSRAYAQEGCGGPGLDTLLDDFFKSTVRDAAVAVAVDVVFYGSAPA